MKQRESIFNTIFSTIDNVIDATKDIHMDIAGIRDQTNEKHIRARDKSARIYDTVKAVNGKVGEIVRGFFK